MEKLTKLHTVSSYSFDPLVSKSCFVVPNRDEYCSKQYLSVSVRLNFEYKKCLESNGIVYFVTFTYNDNGCFHFGNFNFFDNNHIRKFFNKSIFPTRLHDNGYSFRFALFGECGDGKGVRGIDNNPHYHVLVFLYPNSGCSYFYHNERNFLSLCKSAWNQDLSDLSLKRYCDLNVGNVSYSRKGARVLKSNCFSYCSSYCIKTLSVSPYNSRVKSFMAYVAYANLIRVVRDVPFGSVLNDYFYDSDDVQDIYIDFVKKYFKRLPQLATYNRKYDDYLLILNDSVRDTVSLTFGFNDFSFVDYMTMDNDFFLSAFYSRLMETPLFRCFYKYLVNRHKCVYRLSSGLGSCGLDYIDSNFMIDVSFFSCFKCPRINLPSYYFRKYFFTPQRHLNGYVYFTNENYSRYCMFRFSSSKFRSALCSFKANRRIFSQSLSDDDRLSFDLIPSDKFVAYRAFRGLSFSINDVPDIDSSDIWKYLRDLDYSRHHLYSVPCSLSHFTDEYFSFSLHPFFICCDDIDRFSRLYDDFVNVNYSSKKILDTSQYFNLSNVNGKDFIVY